MNPSISASVPTTRPVTGIRGPTRCPHRTSVVPSNAPIETFDPRARLIGSILTGLVLLAFIAAIHILR